MAERFEIVEKALQSLLVEKKYSSLRDILVTMNPADIAGIFEDIENRNPVFTSRFHTDIVTFVFKKPFLEFENRIVKSRKAFLLIRRLNPTSGLNDCGNEK